MISRHLSENKGTNENKVKIVRRMAKAFLILPLLDRANLLRDITR